MQPFHLECHPWLMFKRLTAELEEWVYSAIKEGRTAEARLVLTRFCKHQPVVITLATWGDELARDGEVEQAIAMFKLALYVHDRIWHHEQLTAALFSARRLLEISYELDPDKLPELVRTTNRIIWRLRKSLRTIDSRD